MSLMHPELIPEEPRRPPARLLFVLFVGLILVLIVLAAEQPPTPPTGAAATLTALVNRPAATSASLSAVLTRAVEVVNQVLTPEPSVTLTPSSYDCAELFTRVDQTNGAAQVTIIRRQIVDPLPIPFDAVVTDQFNNCGHRWLSFTAAAGDQVSVRVSADEGELYLSIHDAEAVELIEDPIDNRPTDARIDDFTIPNDGTYYVFVRDLRERVLDFTISLFQLP